MSTSDAIGLVGLSLKKFLQDHTTLEVTLLDPDKADDDKKINLFLYKIAENPAFRNQEWQVSRDDPDLLVPPPISVNLYYILTAYSPTDGESGNTGAHKMFGEAIKAFHEHPVLPEEFIEDDLKGAVEQIKIMLCSPDMDELTKVWGTFSKPFRLSAVYEVSVVQLDMGRDQAKPMPPRVRRTGVPRVTAGYTPPVVTAITPASASPGDSVAFQGENLAGWYAYVTILDYGYRTADPLTGNQFTYTLPADIPLGFFEIQVDISHLFRRTFLLEIKE
jgi:hypothetical protein